MYERTLWREAEDGEAAALVRRRLVLVVVAEHLGHGELAALDPDGRRVADRVEEHGAALQAKADSVSVFAATIASRSDAPPSGCRNAAVSGESAINRATYVGGRHDSTRVVGVGDGPRVGLELALHDRRGSAA